MGAHCFSLHNALPQEPTQSCFFKINHDIVRQTWIRLLLDVNNIKLCCMEASVITVAVLLMAP